VLLCSTHTYLAEREGFEPPVSCPEPDFELDGLRIQNKRLSSNCFCKCYKIA
jgi:hypothetical protein